MIILSSPFVQDLYLRYIVATARVRKFSARPCSCRVQNISDGVLFSRVPSLSPRFEFCQNSCVSWTQCRGNSRVKTDSLPITEAEIEIPRKTCNSRITRIYYNSCSDPTSPRASVQPGLSKINANKIKVSTPA